MSGCERYRKLRKAGLGRAKPICSAACSSPPKLPPNGGGRASMRPRRPNTRRPSHRKAARHRPPSPSSSHGIF